MKCLSNISGFFPTGFRIRLYLPVDAWYETDQVRPKWNRAGGITAALSASTRRTAEVIWQPGKIRGWFLVAVRVWDGSKKPKNSAYDVLGAIDARPGEEIEIVAKIKHHLLSPILQNWVAWDIQAEGESRLIEQHFNGPWYGVYRKLGPKNINGGVEAAAEVQFAKPHKKM